MAKTQQNCKMKELIKDVSLLIALFDIAVKERSIIFLEGLSGDLFRAAIGTLRNVVGEEKAQEAAMAVIALQKKRLEES
jgi:hypothetical protein